MTTAEIVAVLREIAAWHSEAAKILFPEARPAEDRRVRVAMAAADILERLEDDALASQTATCERHEGEADPDCVVCSGLHAVVSIYRRRVKGELAARALLSGGA